VFVVEFVGKSCGPGLPVMVVGTAAMGTAVLSGCHTALGGGEFDFTDQRAAPSFVDAHAEIAGHVLDLMVPFCIRRNFEPTLFAVQGTRVTGQRLADDLRPGTRKPGERRFWPIQFARDASEQIACLLHGRIVSLG